MRFTTLYMPDFPVWAVQFFDPTLQGRDVLVQLSGKVAARSERLRDEGIEKGWAIERARTQAPEALVRAHPGVRTRLAWEIVLRSLNAATPWLEPCISGDFVHRAADREARRTVDALAEEGLAVLSLMDTDGARPLHPDADAARLPLHPDADGARPRLHPDADAARLPLHPDADRARPRLHPDTVRPNDELGGRLHSSANLLAGYLRARIGVADDRATSLLAALSAEHAAARVVAPGQEQAFRDALPLHVLAAAGISEETRERLSWLGFHAVGQLRRLTSAQLQAQFPEGRALCALSRGADVRPVLLFVPPPAVRVEHSLAMPLHEPAAWTPVLQHLLRHAIEHLGERDAQMVTVSMSCGRQQQTSRRLCHEPTSDFRKLWILTQLAMQDVSAALDDGVDGFVIVLEGLVRTAAHQERLWDEERAAFQKALADVEKRLPGLSLRVVGLDCDVYLPEEAFQLLPTASPAPSPPSAARRGPRRAKPAAPAPKPGAARAAWESARVLQSASAEGAGRLRKTRRSSTGHIRHDGFDLDEPGLL